MNVLVTGAGGFIGGHLVEHLVKQGCTVTAVSRRPRMAGLRCRWLSTPQMDLSADWAPLLAGIDSVVHLAGLAHSRAAASSVVYQQRLQRINVDTTAALYRDSSRCGIGRFLFVSSIAALTSRSVGQLTAATPAKPSTPYGKSKLAAERAIEFGYPTWGCPYTILRPPVIYGRGNPANMHALMQLIRSGVPLPFRSLTNRRSILYVENLCDVIYRCLTTPAAANQTFLVSDGCDLSTPELICHIATAAKVPCRLFAFPEGILRFASRFNPDDSLAKLTGSLYLDIEPLKRSLSWTPLFSVSQGLARTLI